ncbi:uncharacterized protein LOC106866063 [Brachypodium distachyon]|uniref:uncharacterized protein LOC106866063 n=1 Tax=Brachypodium distachyon TaxID=15368 RepID=UPI00071E47A0|nr:uncharacterized protein LOC106866063 [Brachypodium distachyon]|eukprot:XP_014754078.1 uncharacterized protein LOC106866063 [Brachypodium distachyon]
MDAQPWAQGAASVRRRSIPTPHTSPPAPRLQERPIGEHAVDLDTALSYLPGTCSRGGRRIQHPTELELLEAKERNLVAGFSLTYVHCNFLVKGLDGTPTLFFAEMYPCCTREEDVILCTPLKENDSGHCFGCNYREKTHPTSVGCPGGHEDVIFPYGELDSDHDTF